MPNSSNPNFGIFTVNTSNPTDVTITGVGQMSLDTDVNAMALDVANNQVFLATSLVTGEVTSIDITTPQTPTAKATIDLPGTAVSLAFNGSNLYVANNTVDQQLVVIGQGQ